ncbi:MAG: recombinase family protein [Ktedonobacterales bacterium]
MQLDYGGLQRDVGTSLETQEIDGREYCRSKGYEVLDVVQEIHTGVDLNERSKLSYVRDMIKRRQADVLVVWKFDRLSRDMTHQAVILFEAEQVGARLESVHENFNDTTEGRLLSYITGFLAQKERDAIAKRSRAGRQRRAESGKLTGNPYPAYGYRYNKDRTAYIEDPITAPIVRRIFEMASAATPVRTIARILTKEGIPSPYGRPSWTDSGVRVILGNSYYWGKPKVMRYRVIRGTVIDRRTGAQKIGKKITRSDEPVAVPLTAAPALISEALAHLAEKNRRRMPGNPYKKHPISLLHGRVFCGECGKRCIEQPSFSGFHYYRCASHNHNLAKVSCHVHIPTKLLDEQVWYALTRKLSEEPALVEDFVISSLGEAPSPQYLKEQLESLEL